MTNIFAIPPIIGQISNGRAVVIFVTYHSVKLKFVSKRDYDIVSKAGYPTRFIVDNLKPDQLYTLRCFYKDENIHTQRLSTYQPDILAFLNCDYPELDTTEPLWDKLSESGIDLVLHLGDNAYKKRDPIDAERAYHERYAMTWSRWAPLLRDSRHLMIPDDYENTDNYQEESAFDLNGKIAMRLKQEYQSALFLKGRPTVEWIGSTLLYFSGIPVEDIYDQAEDAKRLILCLSSAPLFRFQGVIGWIINKLTAWTLDQLNNLYRMLFDWLDQDPEREVIIVAGDLHIGCQGVVTRGNRSLRIFVTSPISYHPVPILSGFYASQLQGEHHFGPYKMNIQVAKAKRNYLTMDLKSNQAKLTFSDTHAPKSCWNVF